MTYSFTGSGTSIIVTADTESGNFPIDNQSYSGASAILANNRIYLREYGMDKQNFAFFEISTIDGVAPTDLEDAFDKLLLLIANFNGGGTAPYKVYTALLTQSGTNAPVATVLENTLGGDVVWSYNSIGIYHATSIGSFTENKTILPNTYAASSDGGIDSTFDFFNLDENIVSIRTRDITGINQDNLINFNGKDFLFEIRVYN